MAPPPLFQSKGLVNSPHHLFLSIAKQSVHSVDETSGAANSFAAFYKGISKTFSRLCGEIKEVVGWTR